LSAGESPEPTIAGGGAHLDLAHEVIFHVGAAGGERRLFQKNQVGVADDVVPRSRPVCRELVTSEAVTTRPRRHLSLAVAAKRNRTREVVQIGRTARRCFGEPRHAAEAAPRRRPGADGEPTADRGQGF